MKKYGSKAKEFFAKLLQLYGRVIGVKGKSEDFADSYRLQTKMTDWPRSSKVVVPGRLVIKEFVLVFSFTMVILGGLVWYTWRSNRHLKALATKHFRVLELSGEIVHIDEVLTMSARMAVATGELQWQERYRNYEPLLDAAIKEVIELTPEKFMRQAIEQTDLANIKLVEMENRSFDLIRQGQLETAAKLLHSDEYIRQKQVYSNGITEISNAILSLEKARLKKEQQIALTVIVFLVVTIPLIGFIWFTSLRILRRYIDERKRANHALRAARDDWENIFESITDQVTIMDPDYRIIDANLAAITALNRQKDQIIGRHCYELFHCSDHPPGDCPHTKLLKSGHPETAELEMEIMNKTFLITISPVFDQNGQLIKTINITKDITARKKAEQALKEQIEEMRALNSLNEKVCANLPLDQMVRAALEGLDATLTPDISLFFLRKNEDLILQDFNARDPKLRNIKMPIHRVGQCLCGRAVKDAQPIYSKDLYHDPRCTWQDCKKAGLHSLAALPLLSRGNVLGVLGIASKTERDFEQRSVFLETISREIAIGLQNSLLFEEVRQHAAELKTANVELASEISERKRTQEALKEQTRLSTILLDSMPCIALLLRPGSREIVASNAAAAKVGAVPGEKCFETGSQRQTPCPWCLSPEVWATGHQEHLELEYEGIFWDAYWLPVSEDLYMHYAFDVTERKRAEKEREELLKNLAAKNEELESIVYVSSHDLRTPLVNIQGFSTELGFSCKETVEMLSQARMPKQAEQKLSTILRQDIPSSLEYIRTSVDKMDMLLNGLLRLSRTGRAAMEIRTLDMNRLIAKAIKSMEHQIRKSGATVTVDPLPTCLGDKTQIGQVFTNLIDNAIKYLDPDKEKSILISAKTDDGMSIYCVSDTGIGINPNHLDKIFEIFHRLNPQDSGPGEGLGLTIVRRILDRHNGKIWVESEPKKGSRFYVALPDK